MEQITLSEKELAEAVSLLLIKRGVISDKFSMVNTRFTYGYNSGQHTFGAITDIEISGLSIKEDEPK